ncbi:hypothetical protein LLG46_08025 [bacterium]|nr:hypothetical protein [bacterium]
MNKPQAEQDIKLIREIMERSAKYTHFTGLSGVLSGIAALVGTYATYWIYVNVSLADQNKWSLVTWLVVFIFAISEDFMLAGRNARKQGTTIWNPVGFQIIKAVFPGVFIAFVISLVALVDGAVDAIPGVLALGYGAALCSAGLFSIKEVWTYGIIQLITGTIALFFMSRVPYSLYALALSFGVYQIIFGIWIAVKYHR